MLYSATILISTGYDSKLIEPKDEGFLSRIKKLLVVQEKPLVEELHDVSDLLEKIGTALTDCKLTNLVRISHDSNDFYLDTAKKPHDLPTVLSSFRLELQTYYERFFEEVSIVLEDVVDQMEYAISIRLSRVHYIETFPIRIRISGNPVSIEVSKPEERFGLFTAKMEQAVRKYLQIAIIRFSGKDSSEFTDANVRPQSAVGAGTNVNLLSKNIFQLFPLYGVELGTTTVSQLAKLGVKAQDINSRTSKPYDYYKVSGMNFWFDAEKKITTHIYITYSDPMPEQWQNRGFDWQASYNTWRNLFEKKGYKIIDEEQPGHEIYRGSRSFKAEFHAVVPFSERINLSVELDFSYSKISGQNGKGTLYSIRIRSIFVGD